MLFAIFGLFERAVGYAATVYGQSHSEWIECRLHLSFLCVVFTRTDNWVQR